MTSAITIGSEAAISSPELAMLVERATDLMKSEIIQSAYTQIDPRAYRARMPVLSAGYPNPVEVRSIGRVIADRLGTMRSDKKDSAVRAITRGTMSGSPSRSGLLASGVDPKAGDYALDQADALREFSFINDAWVTKVLPRMQDMLGQVTVPEAGAPQPAHEAQVNRLLRFNLHEVKCIDETNPEWFGHDEIASGGVTQDDKGVEGKITGFKVGGGFSDGVRKVYDPPRNLAEFALDNDYSSAKSFLVWLALAEGDNGGFSDFLGDLYVSIKAELQSILLSLGAAAGTYIGAHIGGTLGTAIGGPLGTVLGVASGAVLGSLTGWLRSALEDDIFDPRMASISLPDPSAAFAQGSPESNLYSLHFEGFGGLYAAHYGWELVR